VTNGENPNDDKGNSQQPQTNREEPGIGLPKGPVQSERTSHDEGNADNNPKPFIIVRLWRSLRRRRVWLRIGGHPKANIAEKVTVLITACILIVGGVQAYIYWRQTRVMQSSLSQNERGLILNWGQLAVANRNAKTAERSAGAAEQANITTQQSLESIQRAFIFADTDEPISITNDKGETAAVIIRVKMENAGVTPTRHFRSHINFIWRPDEIPEGFNFPDLWSDPARKINAPAAIGPKAKVDLPTDPIPLNLLEQVKNGKLHLYLYGWGKYNDIFPKTSEHITKFCYRASVSDSRAQSGAKALTIQYTNCPTHNCFDDECASQKH
jgi:hypothetical protein